MKQRYIIFLCVFTIITTFYPFLVKNVFASSEDTISQTNETGFQEWGVSPFSIIPHIINLAQSFKSPDSDFEVRSIDVKLARFNSGFNDNVFLTIRSDNNNSPSDFILATSDQVNGDNITPFKTQNTVFAPQSTIVRFNFNQPYNLAPFMRYWFVLERANYVDYSTSNFYANRYSGGVSNYQDGVLKYLYQGWWYSPSPYSGLWFVINNTVDSPSQFWSKVQNSPTGSLDLRQTPGTQDKPDGDIIETIANGRAIQVLSTSDDSYINSVDVDGYRWYKIEDMTNGKIGWAEARLLSDGTVYLSYDQNNQTSLETEAIAAVSRNIEQLQTNGSIMGGNAYVQNPGFNIDITDGNLSLNNVVFRVKKQDGAQIDESCKWQAQVWTLNSASQQIYHYYLGSEKLAQEINNYTDFTDVKFNFDSVTLFNNTKYHILIYTDSSLCPGANDFPIYAYDTEDVAPNTNVAYTRYDSDRYLGNGDLYFKINIIDQKPAHNPVIIVPGIAGSYLNENTFLKTEIWPDFQQMLGLGDSYLDELAMLDDGSPDSFRTLLKPSDAIRKVEALGAIKVADVLDGLIKELEKDGYEENKDLFVFSYDWRADMRAIAGKNENFPYPIKTLKNEIDDVIKQTGAEKVDIVAHSMGGLLVKTFISEFDNSTIGKLIFVATPNFGTPKAFKALMYGDNLGLPVLNEKELYKISQNMPAVYQLLPSRAYLDIKNFNIPNPDYKSYVADIFDIDNNNVRGNLNYDQTIGLMRNEGRNNLLLGVNDQMHQEIDGITFSNSYSITGCGTPTDGKFYVLNKEKNGAYEYGLKYISGDDTVPLESAAAFGENKIFAKGGRHMSLPSINGDKQLIAAILQNNQQQFDFSKYGNLTLNKDDCVFSGTQISFHSPISINAYDEFGNHTGLDGNGNIEINILGATYENINDNKFIFLPAGQNYSITGQASSSGTFNARVQVINDSQYIKEAYFNEIPLTSSSSTVKMSVSDNQSNFSIKLDENGDGNFEKEAAPSSILNGEELNDISKPISEIKISGQLGNGGYYVSNATAELIVTDSDSGILKTEYSLDNGITWQNYQDKFVISQNGTTTIYYSSTDRAGNREENKIETITIDREKPEIIPISPQDDQNILRSGKLNIDYLAGDNYSGIAEIEVYFDDKELVTSTIDLFGKDLGAHKVKIIAEDRAGNMTEKEINFQVIASFESATADIFRVYEEGDISKKEVKNDLVDSLGNLQNYIQRYGQVIEKRQDADQKIMAKCIAKKGEAWCHKKLDKIFIRIDYRLDKVYEKIIQLKFATLLDKLRLYNKKDWITDGGYDIIKSDIEYLLNNVK
jgi:pimeloyl-ACP methyl ester carboxylesterase